MTPVPTVRKVAPACWCGATTDLILGDGPAVCRSCIREGGVMAAATVRRNDTRRDDRTARDGLWR